MAIADLSIKRPIFITSVVILMIILGIISWNRLGVDLFPDVTEPGLSLITTYPGAAPEEIEELISKPLESEMSSLSGLKHLTSQNYEGLSLIFAEFEMGSDIKYMTQQTIEILAKVKGRMPEGIIDQRVEPWAVSEIPIMWLSVSGDVPPGELYDIANDDVKPLVEQADKVSSVTLFGGTKREIQVELDRNKLNTYNIPAVVIANQIQGTGINIPVGKNEQGNSETIYRTIGNFETLKQIENTVVSFSGDVNKAVSIKDLGDVKDAVEEPKNIAYYFERVRPGKGVNDYKDIRKRCILLSVKKQQGANTVQVSDNIKAKIERINEVLKNRPGGVKLSMVYDRSKLIRSYLGDVKRTIVIAIVLSALVVYLFLGNIRSTLITGIAIPNSLCGAFLLMYVMGFTLNMLTLLALSLTIGLLVDDAIVVRENIFRKLQSGMNEKDSAEIGTKQVMLAVIATSLTVIAVFLPVGFMKGVVGQYFKQFGLTVVFAMAVSLFDALTVAPLLSAYFAGTGKKAKNIVVLSFDRLQEKLDSVYSRLAKFSIERPLVIIMIMGVVFVSSLFAAGYVKKTFMPGGEDAEYSFKIKLKPGTSLAGTEVVINQIEERIKKIPELNYMSVIIGNDQGESHVGQIDVFMLPFGERKRNSDELQEELRKIARDFQSANPSVSQFNLWGDAVKNFILNIKGEDLDELNAYAAKMVERLKSVPDLTEVESSATDGKPEFQIKFDTAMMQSLGVTAKIAGAELRYHIAGEVVGKLHQNGKEYDIRLRLRSDQRNLKEAYGEAKVPNIHYRMIPLNMISTGKEKLGPTVIMRQDRARVVQVMANLAPGGASGSAMDHAVNIMKKEMPLPKGMSYGFWGDTEAFTQTLEGFTMAFMLSIVLIYLILSSLYESFLSPITILLAIPPAISGAFFSLMVTGEMLSIFGMIGVILLLGLVTKNSILLVDYAVAGVNSGLSRKEAVYQAGVQRLRPILMTTFAMLAGTLPVALGMGEAGKMQRSMGIAIMGGLIISTLITLLVVPAVFEYVDVFREKIERRFRPGWRSELLAAVAAKALSVRGSFKKKKDSLSSHRTESTGESTETEQYILQTIEEIDKKKKNSGHKRY